MDVREKLVELVHKIYNDPRMEFNDLYEMNEEADTIADIMIENGVTVQEWISVKDRLPEIYTQVLCFTGTSVQIAMYEGNDRWFTNYHSYTLEGKNLFTHWMPLPQPPKGE